MLTAESSYKENDERCSGEEAAHPDCRGGERPATVRGLSGVFHSERDFELISSSLPDVRTQQGVDLVLVGDRPSQNLFDVMATLKAARPNLRIIVIGSGTEDETILKAIAFGAKGYVDVAASPADFVHAIRVVSQGSVWAPRRVLSTLIERVSSSAGCIFTCKPDDLYRPRERSFGDAGGGPIEQGDWCHTRHRSAHGQSPCLQAATQEWCSEPHRTFGKCRYAFDAGFLLVKATETELWLFGAVHANSLRAFVVPNHRVGGKHGIVHAETVSNAWVRSRILRPQT